jgi:hypothetical protein
LQSYGRYQSKHKDSRIALWQAVNFFSFDMFRKALQRALGPNRGNEAKLAAGALAGLPLFSTDSLQTIG